MICKLFIYGGCQGNANNYKTLQECNDSCFGRFCPKLDCSLKCKLKKNEKTGCSICECEDPCEVKKCENGLVCVSKPTDCKDPPCPLVANCVDACTLPKKPGPCKGSFKRYYFDIDEMICKAFIYGGCQGNANNYKTLEECNDSCFGRSINEETQLMVKKCENGLVCVSKPTDCKDPPCPLVANCVDACTLPKKPGPCKGSFKRYYFDIDEMICKAFIYGGCQGNANNYKTLEECNDSCFGRFCPKLDCSLKCKLKKNEKTGCSICECEDPCEVKKCENGLVCVSKPTDCKDPPCPLVANCVDACTLPKKPGPCRGSFRRYYFDIDEMICKVFIYGGCQGNANNYKTLEECNDSCFGRFCPKLDCSLKCKLKKNEKTGCSICECEDPCEVKNVKIGWFVFRNLLTVRIHLVLLYLIAL
ncbi:hypothetical protein LSH36_995g00059, partial [Paralvinella palmiformis]